MLNKKLFAICLLVDDIDKTIDFYTTILELEINTHEESFVDFKLGETGLAAFQKSEATAMYNKKYMSNGGGALIAFQTPDLNVFCEELKRKGIELIEGPKETPWGQKVAYLIDPDKNVVEVSE